MSILGLSFADPDEMMVTTYLAKCQKCGAQISSTGVVSEKNYVATLFKRIDDGICPHCGGVLHQYVPEN